MTFAVTTLLIAIPAGPAFAKTNRTLKLHYCTSPSYSVYVYGSNGYVNKNYEKQGFTCTELDPNFVPN